MSEFLSVLRAELRNPVPYLLVGTLGLLLAIAGPFGSYLELRFVQRLLFWGLCMALGMGVGILWRVFMQTVLGTEHHTIRRRHHLRQTLEICVCHRELAALALFRRIAVVFERMTDGGAIEHMHKSLDVQASATGFTG